MGGSGVRLGWSGSGVEWEWGGVGWWLIGVVGDRGGYGEGMGRVGRIEVATHGDSAAPPEPALEKL